MTFRLILLTRSYAYYLITVTASYLLISPWGLSRVEDSWNQKKQGCSHMYWWLTKKLPSNRNKNSNKNKQNTNQYMLLQLAFYIRKPFKEVRQIVFLKGIQLHLEKTSLVGDILITRVLICRISLYLKGENCHNPFSNTHEYTVMNYEKQTLFQVNIKLIH